METVTLNPLEQPQFTITRSLIGQLHIDCPGNPPLLLHPTVKTIPVIVSTNVCSGRIIRDEPFYIVEINVNVSSAIDNGLKAHDLMFVYMAFVHINDTSIDEDCIHHILNDVVPKSKFNDINTIIFNATNSTGYPVTLDKKQYEESISDNGTTEWDEDLYFNKSVNQDEEKLNYKYILDHISSDVDIAEFLKKYNSHIGVTPTDNYENLPAYFYYLRFIIPIEYNHPKYKECDKSVWPMLFQLLFGNPDVTCRITNSKNSLPEIEFSYECYNKILISQLSMVDLKDLLSKLLIDLFKKTSIRLLDYADIIDTLYCMCIHDGTAIRKKTFFKIYGYDKKVDVVHDNAQCFLEKLYSKISYCNKQTIKYRCSHHIR